MKSYEYEEWPYDIDRLKAAGSQGWKLVGIWTNSYGAKMMILEREIE